MNSEHGDGRGLDDLCVNTIRFLSVDALVSDGDLMEGVASEAASLAGHLGLGKLIYPYDDNRVSLSASTDLTFSEDRARRFAAYGWHTTTVEDGNDLPAIERAIDEARREVERPSLILVRTHIGYGAPHKQDPFEVQGSPLGSEETRLTKEHLDWPVEPPFVVPTAVRLHMGRARSRGEQAEAAWNRRVAACGDRHPDLVRELRRLMDGSLPGDWDADLPRFEADVKGLATRVAGGRVLAAIARRMPELMGGSADLDPSTHTALRGQGDFQNPSLDAGDRQGAAGGAWSYAGRNLHFGVREHAMAAVVNGLAAHGGVRPFGATFLVFSDYMRPCDANETAIAWRVAIERARPVALILTRQAVPTLDRAGLGAADGLRRGAYVLADPPGGRPELILIATGSEVSLALEAMRELAGEGTRVRVVSMPSWELFDEQPASYRDDVLPRSVHRRVAIEAGAAQGWHRSVGDSGDVLAIERFGASAPGEVVLAEYGFTVANVCARARALHASPERPRDADLVRTA